MKQYTSSKVICHLTYFENRGKQNQPYTTYGPARTRNNLLSFREICSKNIWWWLNTYLGGRKRFKKQKKSRTLTVDISLGEKEAA